MFENILFIFILILLLPLFFTMVLSYYLFMISFWKDEIIPRIRGIKK